MTSRLMKKTSVKKGLQPGSLIHIGEQKVEKVRIRVIDYEEANLNEHEFESVEECLNRPRFTRQSESCKLVVSQTPRVRASRCYHAFF
jgi:hypothetical protein